MNDTRPSPATDAPLQFTVTSEESGLRLDAFLTQRCSDLTRNRIQGDLEQGLARVDGKRRPKSFKLKAGQEVIYAPRPEQPLEAVAQDIPLDVVYRDEDLLILNKPAGMVVHPSQGHSDGTVVNALLHLINGLDAGDDPLRPGIVHRLDRDTTGLLAVALNHRAHAHLAQQLRDRRMGRHYLCISWGTWDTDSGVLEGDIGRHPRQRQKMAVVPQGGRQAVTRYEVIASHSFAQVCRVKLETGRTHQIRVHFAHHHHPVLGDPTYGDDHRAKAVHALDRTRAARAVKLATRQMLHAQELELVHPRSGENMTFSAPIPADMARVMAALEGEEALS